MTRLLRSLGAALLLLAIGGSVALAHPLGNFTVNQYAGIRVEPDRILLDVVIDAAEIPTFQLVAALDRDGDGALTGAESDGLAADRCLAVGRELHVAVDGSSPGLSLTEAGVAFPEGNGGLRTMRLACGFEAPARVGAATRIKFRNDYEAARIGWHEVTVSASGATVAAPGVPGTSTSARLTAYPSSLASAPDVREATFEARAGGPVLAPFSVPEATPVGPIVVQAGTSAGAGGEAAGVGSPRASGGMASTPSAGGDTPVAGPPGGAEAAPVVVAGAVPGGAEALPDVVRSAPVDPLVALLAFGVAILLGAGHALTPGHGKTLMAAYLVGTRGTRRHALGLGLAVSVSHTTGILVLAFVILAAERTLPADVVVRAAPIVAALSFVVVGAWMLAAELRRRLAATAHARSHAQRLAESRADEAARLRAHGHEHEHEHGHGSGRANPHGHEHDHAHDREREHPHDLEHAHGSVRHAHLPAGGTVTWRGLFLLGLAGGLVPSANALLILLGTVAAGRPAWGVVLVVAFGMGMAAVMGGIGLALVLGRERLERSAWRPRAPRVAGLVPLGAAVAVLAIGLVLTTQALAAARLG